MKNKKLNLNIFMLIFLAISLLCAINDIVIYFTNLKYIYSLLISIIITGGVSIFLKKYIKIKNDFEKSDIIFFIFLGFIFLITFVFPDRNFDTLNYHIYIQDKPFGDKIFTDFFPGRNINTFTYPLADRMMYLFRYFIGYRLGVVINYLVLVILYYQIKFIIKKVLNKKINAIFVTLFSLLITFSLSIIDLIDCYSIDNFSIITLLEILIISIYDSKLSENKRENTPILMYIAYLCGISVAIKISNLVFIVLLFFIFIFHNKDFMKKINFKTVLLFLLTFVFPFIIYFIYTYIETRNPVFPFYNGIFKSEYFPIKNWKDTNFGPYTLYETIVWPVKMFFYPNRAIDSSILEPMWSIGFIVSLIYLLKVLTIKIFKKNNLKYNKELFKLVILNIIFNMVWCKFLLGYTRYGFIVLVLDGIVVFCVLTELFMDKKNISFGLLIIALLYNLSYSSYNYMYSKADWLFNNIFNNGIVEYKYNLKRLFSKDKKIKLEENSAFVVTHYNSAYQYLFDEDIDVLNLAIGLDTDKTDEILEDRLKDYDKLYTIVDTYFFEATINNINKLGYEIVDFKYTLHTNLTNSKTTLYVIEIKKNDKLKNKYTSFQGEIDYNLEKSEFWLGFSENMAYYNGIQPYVKISSDDEEIIFDKVNKDGKLKKYNLDNYKDKNIKIEVVDKNKNKLEGIYMNIFSKYEKDEVEEV